MAISLTTKGKLKYQFYPVSGQQIHFRIKARHDAHLVLTSGPIENDPMWKVIIGGWDNTKSMIQKNRLKPLRFTTPTPDILSANDMRGFWVKWSGGCLTVGREGEYEPFMIFDDPEPFNVAYFGVCTGCGASGEWLIEDSSQTRPSAPPSANSQMGGRFGGGTNWRDASSSVIPPDAVVGGEMLPGKARRRYRETKQFSTDSSSTDAGDQKNLAWQKLRESKKQSHFRSSSESSVDRRNPSTSPEPVQPENSESKGSKRKRSMSVDEIAFKKININK